MTAAGLPSLPDEPPPGCWSPLIWQVARQALIDHQAPRGTRYCPLCRPQQTAPCLVSRRAMVVLDAVSMPAGRAIIEPPPPGMRPPEQRPRPR